MSIVYSVINPQTRGIHEQITQFVQHAHLNTKYPN